MGGIDNKYNLVELAPAANAIQMNKRAILQMYVEGDTKLTHIVGNMSYEVPCQTASYTDLQNTFHFTEIEEYQYIEIPLGTMMYGKDGVQVDIGGIYYFTSQSGDEYFWYRTDNLFYIWYARMDYSAYSAMIYQVVSGYPNDWNVTNYLPSGSTTYWAEGGISSTDGNGRSFDYYDMHLDSHGSPEVIGNPWHCNAASMRRLICVRETQSSLF